MDVATSNGSVSQLRNAFAARGHGTSNIVDIDLGYGTGSLTTVAGDLDIDGDTITSASILNINPGGNVIQSTALLVSFQNALGSVLTLSNTGDNATGGGIILSNTGGGVDMSDGDALGSIEFKGKDDGTPSEQSYAKIEATIADVTDGQEAGKLEFQVAEYDGTVTTGLKLDGDTDANGEIDVTIGAGAASTTTIAGDLDIDGEALTTAGALNVTPGGCLLYTSPSQRD